MPTHERRFSSIQRLRWEIRDHVLGTPCGRSPRVPSLCGHLRARPARDSLVALAPDGWATNEVSSPARSSTRSARFVLPRAAPRFHRDRRHPSSLGRGRDRSGDDHDEAPYPYHDRGTKTCSAGRDREGGREGNRWLDDSNAPALFRVSEAGSTIRKKIIRIHESRFRGGLASPSRAYAVFSSPIQETRGLAGVGPLAQQRERQDPGDLAVERRGCAAWLVLVGPLRKCDYRHGALWFDPRCAHRRTTRRRKGGTPRHAIWST